MITQTSEYLSGVLDSKNIGTKTLLDDIEGLKQQVKLNNEYAEKMMKKINRCKVDGSISGLQEASQTCTQ